MDTSLLTALAEPNRIRIVETLRNGPCSVGDLSLQLVIRQPQVSKHLKILSQAGWVEAGPRTQRRLYRLQKHAFDDLSAWLSTFRECWEGNYRRLDALLQELQEEDHDQ